MTRENVRMSTENETNVIEKIQSAEGRIRSALDRTTPEWDEDTMEKADLLLEGKIRFMDEVVELGRSNIDWSGSHIDHHVWKSRPNRFLYITSLAAGYGATGDEEYAAAARDYIQDWINTHPSGRDWKISEEDNPLNLPIRVGDNVVAARGWLGTLPYFLDSPAFDEEFVARMVDSIRCQLRWLIHHLSPTGNFRMFQAMALINAGLRLRFVDEAQEWRRTGSHVMNDMSRRQIHPDGSHNEHTPGYHLGMMGAFRRCVDLEAAFPELPLDVPPEKIAGMFDYALAFTRPDGSLCGINDSSARHTGTGLNDRLEARRRFRQEHALPDLAPNPSQIFPDAGQAYFRTGWDEKATYLGFDATRWGSAHCHLARNAIQLHAGGRPLIVDPGRITYEMSDPLGPYGKSTRAHSTANLNGWNQITTDPDDFRAWTGDGYGAATSEYTAGYWDAPFGWWFHDGLGHGLGARHRRIVMFIHNRAIIVIDHMLRWDESGRGPTHENPDLEVNWQLAPGPVRIDEDKHCVVTEHKDANLLMLFPLLAEDMDMSVYEGRRNPMRGWVQHRQKGQQGEPAPQLALECSPMLNYEEHVVSVLVPFDGEEKPELMAKAKAPADKSTPGEVKLRWKDGSTDTIFWMNGLKTMIGRTDHLDTDASLLHVQRDADDNIQQIGAADSTYCEGAECQPVIMKN